MSLNDDVRKLIESLGIEPGQKTALLNDLESKGLTKELMAEISGAIDTEEEEFLAKAEEQAENFRKKMENLKKQISEFEMRQKQERKAAQKQADEEHLNTLRNQLNSKN